MTERRQSTDFRATPTVCSSAFEGQFVLGQAPRNVPEGWQESTIAGWTLAAHPALPSCVLRTRDGEDAGWLVGYCIDSHSELVTGVETLPFDRAEEVTAAPLESYLDTLGGRFLCIVLTRNVKRLYMDPVGMLAVVFARRTETAGSTNTLLEWILKREITVREPRLGWLNAGQFYPAGLTGDAEVERVLPNHFLDLNEWRTVRHRLREPMERIDADSARDLVETIARRLAKQVEAVARRHETYMGLTAGRDSRMVLAASKNVIDRMEFLTFAYPDIHGARDVSAARFLARRHGLRHRTIPISVPEDSVKTEYLNRIGYAGHWGKARDFYAGCRAYLDESKAFLTGFAGEIGRAFYWKKINWSENGPESASDVDARMLLKRMRLPLEARFEQAMERWLEGIARRDTPALYDQVYLEHRLGCWAAPHMYGAACFVVNLTPFCHREIVDGMLRLPAEFKLRERLADGIIDVLWPELQRVPFQRKAGLVGRLDESMRRVKLAVKSRIR